MTKGKNYVGEKWRDARARESFVSLNPANFREQVGTFPRSQKEDVDAAVASAREAFHGWKGMSRLQRGEVVDRFVQLVKADLEELARLVATEAGKAINEARADVIEGIHMAQFTAGRARMPHGDVVASEIAEKDSYMLRKPKGVVAAITPWNFPFAIPLWLICPSLLEGNTVVFKPSEDTPLVGQRIVEYFEKAGLPPGVLNLVHGYGEEAGWPLVTHPEVDVVLFTGSFEVGSKIKEACALDYRKMAAVEMGGKNGIIVFDDADMDIALHSALLSAFKTTGQRCTSASRLIVQEGVIRRFSRSLVDMARRIVVGNPLDERVFMGPLINEAATRKVDYYNGLAKEEGAKVLLDGGRARGEGLESGYFFTPFIYQMEHRSDARVLREEVFGPHVAIIPFRTTEEAIAIYNDTDYGMAFSVITEDYRKARLCQQQCEFGVGYWNLPSIGAEVHLPFGGVKKSGTGMPSASTLIDVVTHRIAWTANYAREVKMPQGLSTKVA